MKFNSKITLTKLGYIILGIMLAFLSAGVYTFFKVGSFSRDIAYKTALEEAKRYAETLKSFRSIYTSEVVAEVLEKKHMKITHDYKDPKYDSTGAIPLPATLSMALAEAMTKNNTSVKLYSKYPFFWRKDRVLTDFEKKAFDYFEKNLQSDSAYYEIDLDRQMINYAIPDKMVTMSCVNCHNNHPQSPRIGWKLGDVRGAISITRPVQTDSVVRSASNTFVVMAAIAAIVLIVLVIVIERIRSVRNSIRQAKEIIEKLKVGELPGGIVKVPENEMREVVDGLNILQTNFKNVTTFAESIGRGNLSAEFQKLSSKDSLGISLIEMRNSLQQVAESDARRNWATTGLANLSETLRTTRIRSTDLYDRIIQFIVKYTRSNQGGLFVAVDSSDTGVFLELVACYAYERKKFVSKKIEIGEDLVGQCYLEQEMIYIAEVPKNYVNITSGLGEAVPNCVLLVPLKQNEQVFGVLELAAFHKFEAHEIEFIKKAAESIASAISSTKTAEQTRVLQLNSRPAK